MNNAKFLMTSDKQISDSLIQRGFTLVCYDGDYWTFMMDAVIDFSEEEMKKIKYTDVLMM